MGDCMICIVHGEVSGAVVCDTPSLGKTIAEWSADPKVAEIVRVPVEVARVLLFKRWPGREAALALIAQAQEAPRHGE